MFISKFDVDLNVCVCKMMKGTGGRVPLTTKSIREVIHISESFLLDSKETNEDKSPSHTDTTVVTNVAAESSYNHNLKAGKHGHLHVVLFVVSRYLFLLTVSVDDLLSC